MRLQSKISSIPRLSFQWVDQEIPFIRLLIQLTKLKQQVPLIEIVGVIEAEQPCGGTPYLSEAKNVRAFAAEVIFPTVFSWVVQPG